MSNVRRWLAELIGTYGFVTIGVSAGAIAGAHGLLLAVAIANGVGLGVMIATFMATSGSHFNPAITLSAWIGRKIDAVNAIAYVVAQILGGLLGALTARVIFASSAAVQLGTPGVAPTISVGRAVFAEAIFTFFLATVIWGTAIDERAPKMGGLFIGLTVVVGVLAVGPLTGGAFNPARYLGPAIVAGNLKDWWVYFVGPGIGASVAGVLYRALFISRSST